MQLPSLSLFALIAALASTAAAAQSQSSLSANAGVVTDYRFRGLTQTSFKPAVQGGVDFAHKSGLYLGAWGSNVNWIKDYVGASDGTFEVDLYGGFKGELGAGIGFDVGLIAYQYPGNTADKVLVNADTTEFYGALSLGPVTAKYSQSSGNFIANPNSNASRYLELAATFDLGGGFSLTPHVGRQTIPNQAGDAGDYTDFSLTLGKDFGNGLVATVSAISTDAKDSFYKVGGIENLGKNGLTVGLKYTF